MQEYKNPYLKAWDEYWKYKEEKYEDIKWIEKYTLKEREIINLANSYATLIHRADFLLPLKEEKFCSYLDVGYEGIIVVCKTLDDYKIFIDKARKFYLEEIRYVDTIEEADEEAKEIKVPYLDTVSFLEFAGGIDKLHLLSLSDTDFIMMFPELYDRELYDIVMNYFTDEQFLEFCEHYSGILSDFDEETKQRVIRFKNKEILQDVKKDARECFTPYRIHYLDEYYLQEEYYSKDEQLWSS